MLRFILLRLIHLWFKIQEIFPEGVANHVNKRVRMHEFVFNTRFASPEGNISCIFNTRQVNLFIIYKVVKYRKILLIYNVYFIFSLVKV